MNLISTKSLWITLCGLLIIGVTLWPGYAQTNLQELQNRVAELETKLADAKIRREKAYKVQMQLEEQEQMLAKLEKSEKYKVQVIEIRSDIRNIRTRIESIIKEKNDLEENLRIAKNLQSILRDAQIPAKIEGKSSVIPAQTNAVSGQQQSTTTQPKTKIQSASDKLAGWKIRNIRIDDRFNHEEHKEITKIFISGDYLSQENILANSHQIYTNIGAIMDFIINTKGGGYADLDIRFNQRESRNSNYSSNSSFPFFSPIKTLDEFKKDHFQLTIK
jgi:hypothetical protein